LRCEDAGGEWRGVARDGSSCLHHSIGDIDLRAGKLRQVQLTDLRGLGVERDKFSDGGVKLFS
jgi:hypothetical protein